MADPRYKNGVYVGWGNRHWWPAQQALAKQRSLPRNGWQVVDDLATVDADLLRAAKQEESFPNIYRLELDGHTAWAYASKNHDAVVAVMTNSDQANFYDRNLSFVAITLDVKQRLAAPLEVTR